MQPPPQERTAGNQVDVEQIMREIRGRIAQRQGIDLSNQQIQDLAARRLESILDPRAIKPSLLEALRRTASTPAQRGAGKIPNEPAFSFEDTTLYDSHRGLMRFIRRLLNPILKLFFNPNPLIRALHIQAKLNVEAAEREAERDRRQMEWNALHYEIVQRLVTEVSRASLELQALSLRVESLDAKVDFNERRVRSIEASVHRARPQVGPGRPVEPSVSRPPASEIETGQGETATPGVVVAEGQPAGDGVRRRRRRRRGRRSGLAAVEGHQPGGTTAPDGAEPIDDTPQMTAPMEQLPDTGIIEAPPVPFEHMTATVPFEHPVPMPIEQPPNQPEPPRVDVPASAASAPHSAEAASPAPPAPSGPPVPPDPERPQF